VQPTLNTPRLVLRPFTLADSDAVVRLAGERAIAEMTLLVPHPYTKADAVGWISSHAQAFESGKGVDWAIARASDSQIVGAIGAVFSPNHDRAEFGYWIGVHQWGKGYATEAGRCLVEYCFTDRAQIRVAAHHFARNPASGRVLQKIGLKQEGIFPKHVKKWGEYQDCVMYGLLKEDWKP